MRQAALLVAVVCLVVAPVAGAAGASSGSLVGADGAAAQSGAAQVQADDLNRSGVHIGVQLDPDGDARWNISVAYDLENVNDTAAFDALARSFTAGERDNGFSTDVFRAVVPSVSDRVEREMQITGENRRASRIARENGSTGLLILEFTWTSFSRVENETLVVDSFAGTWFGDLGPDQTLTVRPPDGYDPDTVEPGTSVVDGAYRWEGPQSFDVGEPSLVFTVSPPPTTTTTTTTPVEPPGDGFSTLTVVGIVGVVVVLGGLAVVYARGDFPEFPSPDAGESGERRSDEPAAADDESEAEPDADTTADAGAAGGAAAGASGEPAGGGDGVDPELLSDEERVERLLEENGGRMKQSKIVEETRWSTAKVSQLLSSMDDEGRIEKLRIGRENLISLPGEGVNDE
jgi:hypothetical protein